MNVFSDRLRALRGEMKQAEFARRLGLAQNSYNRYEAGERVPDIEILSRMASNLGVSTDWLLGLDGVGHTTGAQTRVPPGWAAESPKLTPYAERVSESRDPEGVYCPACGKKDKTIASQAESIVNLTRSLADLAENKRGAKKCGLQKNRSTCA